MAKMNKGTAKYTYVEHEDDIKFNAPHHFIVKRLDGTELVKVDFQCGPIKECGVNGCANEDLINMCILRLEGFQRSEFNCHENQMALDHLQEAIFWLRKHTDDREQRGVEGTHTV